MGEGAHAQALMKGLPFAVLLIVTSLGGVGAAVFGLGDDQLLVSPPEIVAEEFVRSLAYGRVGPARQMLRREAERATSDHDLRRISDTLRSRLGPLDDVHATVAERGRETTLVRADIEGERGSVAPVLVMVREYGAWSVARASDVLVSAATPSVDPVPQR